MSNWTRSVQSGIEEEVGIIGEGNVGFLCVVSWFRLPDAQFDDRRGINWATVGRCCESISELSRPNLTMANFTFGPSTASSRTFRLLLNFQPVCELFAFTGDSADRVYRLIVRRHHRWSSSHREQLGWCSLHKDRNCETRWFGSGARNGCFFHGWASPGRNQFVL